MENNYYNFLGDKRRTEIESITSKLVAGKKKFKKMEIEKRKKQKDQNKMAI